MVTLVWGNWRILTKEEVLSGLGGIVADTKLNSIEKIVMGTGARFCLIEDKDRALASGYYVDKLGEKNNAGPSVMEVLANNRARDLSAN